VTVINSITNFKAYTQAAQPQQAYAYQPVRRDSYEAVAQKQENRDKWMKTGVIAGVAVAVAFVLQAIGNLRTSKANRMLIDESIKATKEQAKSFSEQAKYFAEQLKKEPTSRRTAEQIKADAETLEAKFEDLSERTDIVDLNDESLTDGFRKWAKGLLSTLTRPEAYKRKFGNKKAGQNFIYMYGGSGTGKTYNAEVLFKALGAKRLKMQFSDVSSKYIGETSVQITQLFENLEYILKNNPDKKYGLSLDEFETLAKNIEKMTDQESHLEQNRTALINGLDRVRKYKNLYIVASSNVGPKSGKIDGAIARRFGKNIQIEYPTKKALKASLRSQFKAQEAEGLIKDGDFDFFAQNKKEIDKFVETLNQRYAGHGDVETIVSEAISKAENALNEICRKEGAIEQLPDGSWKILDAAKQEKLTEQFRFEMKYLQEALDEKGMFAGEMGNQFI